MGFTIRQNGAKVPLKPNYNPNLGTLMEGESYMAVAKVIPLFNHNNEQKGFKIISLIKIDRSKKKEEKKRETSLESYTDGDELI